MNLYEKAINKIKDLIIFLENEILKVESLL